MRGRFGHRWRDTTRSIWFLPAVLVAGALTAGYLLSRVEVSPDSFMADLLFRGDAAAARELLIVVSGTMITVTGLVFVLTVIALQIASTQYSPRLLRSFLQDLGPRLVLGVFVATFAYSLSGLFEVGQDASSGDIFVPQLAVSGALGLALLSVGMLVYYIQHITNSIQIDAVMLRARRITVEAIRDNHRYPAVESARILFRPEVPAHAVTVPAERSGYLQAVDLDGMHKLANELDAVVRIRSRVGDHLVAGTALGWVWTEDERVSLDPVSLSTRLDQAVMIEPERVIERDIGIGVRQLVDIALRATAPSVNDPYTGIQAIHHLTIVMSELATAATDDIRLIDQNRLVVFVPVRDFEEYLNVSCTHIRLSARDRPLVLVALLEMLETVAAVDTSDERREAIGVEIELIMQGCEEALRQESDKELVTAAADAARAVVAAGAPLGP